MTGESVIEKIYDLSGDQQRANTKLLLQLAESVKNLIRKAYDADHETNLEFKRWLDDKGLREIIGPDENQYAIWTAKNLTSCDGFANILQDALNDGKYGDWGLKVNGWSRGEHGSRGLTWKIEFVYQGHILD